MSSADNSPNRNSTGNSAGNSAGSGGAAEGSARWVRLGPWWVSRAGLDAVAARLQARRLLTDAVAYVVLHKTYRRVQTPEQVAVWFARQFPDVVPLGEEGFIRYVLAVVERPEHPDRPDRPERPEGEPGAEMGGRR